MNWLERLQRLKHKHGRLVIRRNVRAFRQRQKRAGVRRIDLALTNEHYALLRAAMVPGESQSATVGRILESISGKTSQPINKQ